METLIPNFICNILKVQELTSIFFLELPPDPFSVYFAPRGFSLWKTPWTSASKPSFYITSMNIFFKKNKKKNVKTNGSLTPDLKKK